MEYTVELHYERPSGSTGSVSFIVEADTHIAAIKRAKRLALTTTSRKIAAWCSSKATPVRDVPFPPVAPRMIHAGETVTVQMPFTGTVQHVDNDKVELVGPMMPNGMPMRRRMPRAYFEQLTGRKLEPRPPVVTIEYHSIYPNGAHYQSTRPIINSEYGVENLIQVRVTKHDGQIVNKEIV